MPARGGRNRGTHGGCGPLSEAQGRPSRRARRSHGRPRSASVRGRRPEAGRPVRGRAPSGVARRDATADADADSGWRGRTRRGPLRSLLQGRSDRGRASACGLNGRRRRRQARRCRTEWGSQLRGGGGAGVWRLNGGGAVLGPHASCKGRGRARDARRGQRSVMVLMCVRAVSRWYSKTSTTGRSGAPARVPGCVTYVVISPPCRVLPPSSVSCSPAADMSRCRVLVRWRHGRLAPAAPATVPGAFEFARSLLGVRWRRSQLASDSCSSL